MKLKHIKPEQFKVTAWSGGITEEILIDPPEAAYSSRDFKSRISTAVVQAEQSIFTKLSDYTRFIAPLNGSLSLTVDTESVSLDPFEVFEFDGACEVRSQSRPGLRDLNLMVRKGHQGNLEITSNRPSLDPLRTQIVLGIKLDDAGNFLGLDEAILKPIGANSEDMKWDVDWTTGNYRFAVFTLPE